MTQALAEKSWTVALRSTGADTLEIGIYDFIGESIFGEGVTAKAVLAQLRAAPAAKSITMRINSSGGDVDDAKAMINLLADRKANGVRVEAIIDGMAASAASYITTVADKVTMPSNAFLMFHQARTGRMGNASDMLSASELLTRVNEQLAEGYAAASARRGKEKTKADYLAEMAKGDRYLSADEAIEWGLADEKTEPLKAVACLADISQLVGAPVALIEAPYVAHEAPVAPAVVAVVARPLDPARAHTSVELLGAIAAAETNQSPATPALEPIALAKKEFTIMTEPVAPPVQAASEPASVTVSGVKLLGVTNEAEAATKIQDLTKLSMAVMGATQSGSNAEALAKILAWKEGADQTAGLLKQVHDLRASTVSARRDGAIEKLSREGRLSPSQHEWARANFASAEQLETFAMTLPPMAAIGAQEPNGSEQLTLNETERKVCASLGIPESEYLEQKKLEAKNRKVA